jgi:hypothetical protein
MKWCRNISNKYRVTTWKIFQFVSVTRYPARIAGMLCEVGDVATSLGCQESATRLGAMWQRRCDDLSPDILYVGDNQID